MDAIIGFFDTNVKIDQSIIRQAFLVDTYSSFVLRMDSLVCLSFSCNSLLSLLTAVNSTWMLVSFWSISA